MTVEKKLRVVSSGPEQFEDLVNPLLDEYMPIVWNVAQGDHGPVITCILLNGRELRKAQLLAGAGLPGGVPRI